jgi:2-polyprenyl-3-methyl-5-hydroxy-6-metoxy-1,4-benzoquinol methylase
VRRLLDVRSNAARKIYAEPLSETVTLECCPGCGATNAKRLPTPAYCIGEAFFSGGNWGLEHCRTCDLVFTNPRPSESLLSRFYSADGYTPHQSDFNSRRLVTYFASRMEHYQPALKSSGHFLDYGCGGGSLLAECVARGWCASGYDVALPAVRACRARGLDVTNNPAKIPQPVDAIMMCHSLEHVSHMEEPLAAFARILKRDTGRLFIAVPNARSLRAFLSPPMMTRLIGAEERYQAFPIHLSHFSRKSLKHLLARHGFECVAVDTYSFGIDAYFRDSPAPPAASVETTAVKAAPANGSGLKQGVKRVIRGAFMGAGLGENLFGIFRRI